MSGSQRRSYALRSAEDLLSREQIRDTLIRFNVGYDNDDMEMLADTMTADMIYIVEPDRGLLPEGLPSTTPGAEDGVVRVEGRDTLMARYAASRAKFTERGEKPFHMFTNFRLVELSVAEAATEASYIFFIQTIEDGPVLLGFSKQQDRFRKQGDVWRLSQHHIISGHHAGYKRLSTRRSDSA